MGNICSDTQTNKMIRKTKNNNFDTIKQLKSSQLLSFQIMTWKKTQKPDFNSDQSPNKFQITINQSGHLLHKVKQKQIYFLPIEDNQNKSFQNQVENEQTTDISNQNQKKFQIKKKFNGFQLINENGFIFQLLKSQTQVLEGDQFMLGKTQLKFFKIVSDKNDKKNNNFQLNTSFSVLQNYNQSKLRKQNTKCNQNEEENIMCRICMEESNSIDNPLINICNCLGSIKYLHRKCFISWAFTPYKNNNQNIIILNSKKKQCQLCKKALSQSLCFEQNLTQHLLQNYKLKAPLIVIQAIKQKKNICYQNKAFLSYILVSFSQKKHFSIGRLDQNDVIYLDDEMISRKNTLVKLKNNKIFLQDKDSRFGTYVKRKQKILIDTKKQRSFLYKNHLLNVKLS